MHPVVRVAGLFAVLAMRVIAAHRQRVAAMREALEQLFVLHGQLFELYSDSWHEQFKSDWECAAALSGIRERIEALEQEVVLTRAVLTGGGGATHETGKETRES